MKTKVFEPGAIRAAIALLVVFSLPAYAKSGGSTAAHTRVGKTSANAASLKKSGTAQKSEKKIGIPKAVNTTATPFYAGATIAAPLRDASRVVNQTNKIAQEQQAAAARYQRYNTPVRCVGKNC